MSDKSMFWQNMQNHRLWAGYTLRLSNQTEAIVWCFDSPHHSPTVGEWILIGGMTGPTTPVDHFKWSSPALIQDDIVIPLDFRSRMVLLRWKSKSNSELCNKHRTILGLPLLPLSAILFFWVVTLGQYLWFSIYWFSDNQTLRIPPTVSKQRYQSVHISSQDRALRIPFSKSPLISRSRNLCSSKFWESWSAVWIQGHHFMSSSRTTAIVKVLNRLSFLLSRIFRANLGITTKRPLSLSEFADGRSFVII
jgi:hypothetical protein